MPLSKKNKNRGAVMNLKNKKWISVSIVVLASALLCMGAFARGKKEVENKALSRIVSLSPAGTETLFALGLGDLLVARTDFCNYPPEALSVNSLGGFDGKTFSLESVLAFNPDLVYLDVTMHGHLTDNLQNLGIQVFETNIASLDDIYKEIRELALLFDIKQRAEELITTIQRAYTPMPLADMQTISLDTENEYAKVYWEVWNAPYMSVGSSSFINDVIREAGAINIFSDIAAAYPVVSEESIIARNPSLILLPADSPENWESLSKRTGWQSIDAIQNKKVIKIDGDLISRPGPRIGEAIRAVQEALQ